MGILLRKICYDLTGRIELQNQKRIRTLEGKENCKYLGILEADTNKQTEMNEKKVHLANEKTARNQALPQKSHQRDKLMGNLPCKIHGTILKIDKWWTQTNVPKDKKIEDDAQERWHWTTVCVKKKKEEKGLANIEDNVDSSIKGFEMS